MFQPFGDRILVRCTEDEPTTPGGIIIPEEAKEPPGRGVVIAVGEGTLCADGTLVPLAAHVGDEVVFPSYAGTVMEIDGEEVRLLDMQHLLGINLPESTKKSKSRDKRK